LPFCKVATVKFWERSVEDYLRLGRAKRLYAHDRMPGETERREKCRKKTIALIFSFENASLEVYR